MSYADWLPKVQPPWLHGDRGQAWARALGSTLDRAVDAAVDAVQARHPSYADTQALLQLAHDRAMPTFPGEHIDAFRQRVRLARAFWEKAGTLPGVLLWLRAAGYEATVREHFLDDPAIWAEFSVYLWPRIAAHVTDRWDDGVGVWDDGTPWDYQLAATELVRIATLLREVKPAHARVRRVYYIPGPRDVWDDGSAWDDGGAWNPEPIPMI